jgi:serine/threonine-protein kinase
MAASEANIRVVETRGDGSSRVGKYHYIAALAQGGMADVYLAVMRGPIDISKIVVVKEMRRELTEDPDFVGMFLDEARLAARLNHPNVVQTYEVGCEDQRYFLAMEYLDGIPYVRILRMRERVPVPFAIHARILCDTLAGLHYAHELADFDGTPLHVVHRDVSPQNVLVTFGGGVKVVDFGIAKATIAAERRAGDIKGKLAYMAPEQLRTFEVDRRADIFCVGIMLWEAITRKRIWGTQGKPSIPQLLGEEIPDVRSVRKEVPERLARICSRALARDPAERYATAAEMERDLDDYLVHSRQQTSAREVGVFLAEKFTDERERLRVAIDVQLRKLKNLPQHEDEEEEERTLALALAAPPPMLVPHPAPSDAPISSSAALPSAPPSSNPSVNQSSMSGVRRRDEAHLETLPPPPLMPSEGNPNAPWLEPPAPEGGALVRTSWVLVAAGVLFACALGLFLGSFAVGKHGEGRAAPPSSAGAETGSAAASASASTAPSENEPASTPSSAAAVSSVFTTPKPPSAAPPSEVELRVKVSPPGARIFIDGAPVGASPFQAKRSRDGRTHVIRVEAPGYDAKSEELVFDKDAYLALELRRSTQVAPPRPAAPAPAPVPRTPAAQKPGIDVDSPYK